MPPSERSELWDRIQSLLGNGYRVEREIPGGGMSRLFLATDLSLDRSVVVKVLPPELAGEVNAARFQREIAVAAHFQHPHIIPILSAGADESLLYYTMPFVRGRVTAAADDPRGRASGGGHLPPPLGDRGRAGVRARARGHTSRRQAVQHHDRRRARGARRLRRRPGGGRGDRHLTGAGHFVGTTQYMAPEQFVASSDVDGRADVYSLGVVIFEVLTGRFPDEITSDGPTPQSRKHRTTRSLAGLRAEVPRELSELVERALAPEPEARLASATALRDGLEAALTQPTRPIRSTTARRSRPRRRRDRLRGSPLARRLRDPPSTTIASPSRRSTSCRARTHSGAKGFVDLLSSNLDGAGPLRTVPPSVVMRSWDGHADVESAVAFGKRTGARFVVLGHVLEAGRDSARVTAWLVDVVTRRRAEPIELRDATERMDRIADSLTLALLRNIGEVRPVGAVRRASMGSASLPAIRAFLRGEQHLRRTEWDSALAAYASAIALDSNFALAQSHIGLTYALAAIRDRLAGARARAACSLAQRRARIARQHADRRGLAAERRLRLRRRPAVSRARRAPLRHAPKSDRSLRAGRRKLVSAGRRVLPLRYRAGPQRPRDGDPPDLRSLDLPRFRLRPAYIHPVELGFSIGDSARALRYARRYFALLPSDVSAAGTLLAARLMAGESDEMLEARQTVDTASADLLFQAYAAARRALDQRGVALELLRAMSHTRRADYPPLADPAFARHRLALQLSYRGKFAEASELAETRQSGVLAEMALASLGVESEARPVFAEWLRTNPRESLVRIPTPRHRRARGGHSGAIRCRCARWHVAPAARAAERCRGSDRRIHRCGGERLSRPRARRHGRITPAVRGATRLAV